MAMNVEKSIRCPALIGDKNNLQPRAVPGE
jgi:hypothetical protein